MRLTEKFADADIHFVRHNCCGVLSLGREMVVTGFLDNNRQREKGAVNGSFKLSIGYAWCCWGLIWVEEVRMVKGGSEIVTRPSNLFHLKMFIHTTCTLNGNQLAYCGINQ
jgi:hypothetical protein